MIVGIDVGGTNTDVAFLSDGSLKTYKFPNDIGISRILKHISEKLDIENAKLVVSTSLPVNVIASRFDEIRTLSILFPGPGLNYRPYGAVLRGYVNHRGDLVEDIDEMEIERLLANSGFDAVAISGKFSIRNPEIEHRAFEIAKKYADKRSISLSHHVGSINYPLRINTTVVNSKISREIWDLTEEIRRFKKEFFYYKGDGGFIPWKIAVRNPSELYNSSPAAVALGAYYLSGIDNALVVDIGGTTTDLVELKNGKPVMMLNATVHGMRTHIRCVKSQSIPYGGDSFFNGKLNPFRKSSPLAFGGNSATLTDLLNAAGNEIGDYQKSRNAVKRDAAEKEIEAYVDTIASAVENYEPRTLIGTGYLAGYLLPEIAERAGKKFILPDHHESANAVGVAVSRISLTVYGRFDTERGVAIFNGELDSEYVEKVSGGMSDDDFIYLTVNRAREIAERYGACGNDLKDVDVVYFNSFSIVRGGIVRGRIADVVVQIKPGISCDAL